jgi:hypothetical protein
LKFSSLSLSQYRHKKLIEFQEFHPLTTIEVIAGSIEVNLLV